MAEPASTTAPLDESLARILGQDAGAGVKSPITYDPGQTFRPTGDVVQVSGEPAIGATVPEEWTHQVQLENLAQSALQFEYQKQQAAIENARNAQMLELSKGASTLNQAQFAFQQQQANKEFALAQQQEQRAAEHYYWNEVYPRQVSQQALQNQYNYERTMAPGIRASSSGAATYNPVSIAAYQAVGGPSYTGPPLSSGQQDKLALQSGKVGLASVNVFKMPQ